MTILITGATGFVLSNLIRCLAELGHSVIAADRVPPDEPLRAYLSGLRGSVEFRQVDVADRQALDQLVAELRPERAVLGAAITAIPPEVERQRFLHTVEVNVLGTLYGLEALREAGVRRVVVVSSGSIYGPRPDLRLIHEDDPGNPGGLYPLTKWAAEALGARFAEINELDCGVVRLCSPFGPFERDTGSRPLLSLVRTWAAAGLRGEAIRVLEAPDSPRDIAHVADVARGIAAVLLAEQLPNRVYNVGWGRAATVREILEGLARAIPGLSYELVTEEASPGPPAGSVIRGPLDATRLREDLGWAPRYDLHSGLAAYVAWLQSGAEGEWGVKTYFPLPLERG